GRRWRLPHAVLSRARQGGGATSAVGRRFAGDGVRFRFRRSEDSHQLLREGPFMPFAKDYLAEAVRIIGELDVSTIERVASLLAELRQRGGRLFVLGVGGGAGHASHAVSDFRKIANIETYTPTDNVSELTARINDDGWPSVFENWLKVSRLREIGRASCRERV